MIGLEGLLGLIVHIVVVGLVLWLLAYLIDYVGPPEPFRKVAKVVLMVAGVLILIGLLLNLAGRPGVRF